MIVGWQLGLILGTKRGVKVDVVLVFPLMSREKQTLIHAFIVLGIFVMIIHVTLLSINICVVQ